MDSRYLIALLLIALVLPGRAAASGQAAADTAAGGPTEEDYYRLITVPIPEGVVLEVGGLATLPGGRLGVSTRRGDVWVLDNAYAETPDRPVFTRFAQGLHESLGLAYHDGALLAAQRGELTRLRDMDGDGRADRYETVRAWPLSGNYHEYSFGPELTPDGDMLLTLNLAWVGRGASLARWRGWAVEVTEDGELTPIATGMRSPAGFGYNLEGDLFYAENQGDWVGSGFIAHVERGDFLGNPDGLRWTSEPESPLTLRLEDVPNTGEPKHVVAQRVRELKTPAVWFPHGIMGISTSDIVVDSTDGRFGPFEGQLFVGDQGHSKILRVFLEKVDGVYQGAAFPFREGFSSGVLRMEWGDDGSMFVGMTNRGWASTGRAPFGLQRVVWTGEVPFEAERIEARADGFEITFTQPVDGTAAADPAAYEVTGFTYRYHSEYGSPPIDELGHAVRGVVVSDDGLRARLVVDGLRQGYIHEITMSGVRSATGAPLLHGDAYYTLNRIPSGSPLALPNPPPSGAQEPAGAQQASGGLRARGQADARRTAGPPRTGEDATVQAGGAIETPKRQTEMPASWNGAADITITIGVEPDLRFSMPRFDVSAGNNVRLIFNNTDDMLHNLLIVLPGGAGGVAAAALALGLDGARQAYVPESDDVLFHTRLVQPGEPETIYFTAPAEPGEYTYVCTFPGHAVSMRGIMRVLPAQP